MNEFTKCSICFESYDAVNRIPLLLPCQHSFCKGCLRGLVRGASSIDCPMCRVNHNLRFEDVQKNRMIIQMLEANQHQTGYPNSTPYPNVNVMSTL